MSIAQLVIQYAKLAVVVIQTNAALWQCKLILFFAFLLSYLYNNSLTVNIAIDMKCKSFIGL